MALFKPPTHIDLESMPKLEFHEHPLSYANISREVITNGELHVAM